jgi:hypothetical protein
MDRQHVGASLLLLTLSACASSPAAPTRTSRIDVLDFVIGDASLWPRQGDQDQHQLVDRAKHEVCWVKYARPDMFECWRWDDQWIYHEVDHAVDGESGESYTFTDGRWLPRYIDGWWSLDVPENHIHWFTSDCRRVRGPEGIGPDALFPYDVRAFVEPQPTAWGIRDVLTLEYAPYDPTTTARQTPERFAFARGAGWFAWTGSRGTRIFDRVGGSSVPKMAACPEH